MRQTTDPEAGVAVVVVVASLAPQLRPEEAEAAARQVLDAVDRATSPDALLPRARAVVTLAPWLRSEDAAGREATVASLALDAMAKATDGEAWACRPKR